MKKQSLLYTLALTALLSCTDLEEELRSELPKEKAEAFLKENVDFSSLMETVYRDFDSRYIQHAGCVWLFQEISADAAVVPSQIGRAHV